jgi:hypothetical protein
VTYIPLLGNHSVNTFPRKQTRGTIGRPLLGNGWVNTPKNIRDNRRRCFPWGPPRGYIAWSSKGAVNCQKLREFSWRRVRLREFLSRFGSSSGDGSRRWLRRNGKKRIRPFKEDFICDLRWQWDCHEIRCQDTTSEDQESLCVCKSAIALYCL